MSGRSATLTPQELRLLRVLVQAHQHTATAEDLYREVWGHRTKPKGRALSFAIWRLRQKMEEDPSHPQNLVTVWGTGFGLSVAGPEPQIHKRTPHGLSDWQPTDDFVGRSKELGLLGEALAQDGALMTISGPGGFGKTRLAIQWLQSQSPGALPSYYCPLVEAQSGPEMAHAVAGALGVLIRDAGEETHVIRHVGLALAAQSPCLFVLDNTEQIAEAADVLKVWRELAPQARFLVTSRKPLRLSGETLLRLAPLEDSEASKLFCKRLAEAGKNLKPEEMPIVSDIMSRLEGSALAIELAAARARLWPLAVIRDQLSDQLQLLRQRRVDVHPRHLTLWDTLGWSWTLFSPQEKDTLIQCAAFRGPFSLDAFSAVVLDDTDQDPLERIGSLLDTAMVWYREEAGQLVISLAPAVRAFVEERIEQSDEHRTRFDQARERHLTFFAEHQAVLQAFNAKRIRTVELYLELNALSLQIHGATEWALASQNNTLAVRLGVVMLNLWRLEGKTSRRLDLSEALAALADGDEETQGWSLFWRGLTLFDSGEPDRAANAWQAVLEKAQALNNPDLEGRTAARLALLRLYQGRLDDAEPYLSIPLRAEGFPGVVGMGLHVQARLALYRRDLILAETLYQQAATQYRQAQDDVAHFGLLLDIAQCHTERGNWAASLQLYEEALVLGTAKFFQHHQISLLVRLTKCELNLGHLERAEERLQQAEELSRLGMGEMKETIISHLRGEICESLGDDTGAEDCYRRGLHAAKSHGMQLAEPVVRLNLGAVLLRTGRVAQAKEQISVARDLAVSLNRADLTVLADCHLVLIDRFRGVDVQEKLAETLSKLTSTCSQIEQVSMLLSMALSTSRQGLKGETQDLIERARAISDNSEWPPSYSATRRFELLSEFVAS